MALPSNFSEWEHLQLTIMQVHNRRVREEFADIDRDDLDPDITTPRGALRYACLMKDSDSAIMALNRQWLFYAGLRKCQDFWPAIYNVGTDSPITNRRGKPKITLYFIEDALDVDEGYEALDGTISFRLMTQTDESLTLAEARNYANKIKVAFTTANGFVWKKGKLMAAYTDWNKSYQLQLLARTESEARRVIEQVLDVQNHTPDWKHLNISKNEEPAEAYPTIPPVRNVLGQSRRLRRKRPICDVRFQWATLTLDSSPKPMVLVDRGGRWRNALVEVD